MKDLSNDLDIWDDFQIASDFASWMPALNRFDSLVTYVSKMGNDTAITQEAAYMITDYKLEMSQRYNKCEDDGQRMDLLIYDILVSSPLSRLGRLSQQLVCTGIRLTISGNARI